MTIDFADLFPSNCIEWEPIESLTGLLEVWHSEVGEEMYKSRSIKGKNVFFYNSMYLVSKLSVYGTLRPISLPRFLSGEWSVSSTYILEGF